jgi:hypothetical protein
MYKYILNKIVRKVQEKWFYLFNASRPDFFVISYFTIEQIGTFSNTPLSTFFAS